MNKLLQFLKTFLFNSNGRNTVSVDQDNVTIWGDQFIAGGDITINKLYTIYQQQEFQIESFTNMVNDFSLEVAKSANNIASYIQELQIIDANHHQYPPDELRHRVVRWVDRIEDEIHSIAQKTRILNTHSKSVVQFIESARNDAIHQLGLVPYVHQHQSVTVIQALLQAKFKSDELLQHLRSVITTLQTITMIENMPRRISIAANSLMQELDDLTFFASRSATLVQETVTAIQNKVI